MEIRRAEAADMAAVKALWAYCFEREGDPFFEWYFGRVCRPEDVLLGAENGQAAASLHLRPYTLSVRGKTFAADYIVGVSTHPAARGRGRAGSDLLSTRTSGSGKLRRSVSPGRERGPSGPG